MTQAVKTGNAPLAALIAGRAGWKGVREGRRVWREGERERLESLAALEREGDDTSVFGEEGCIYTEVAIENGRKGGRGSVGVELEVEQGRKK